MRCRGDDTVTAARHPAYKLRGYGTRVSAAGPLAATHRAAPADKPDGCDGSLRSRCGVINTETLPKIHVAAYYGRTRAARTRMTRFSRMSALVSRQGVLRRPAGLRFGRRSHIGHLNSQFAHASRCCSSTAAARHRSPHRACCSWRCSVSVQQLVHHNRLAFYATLALILWQTVFRRFTRLPAAMAHRLAGAGRR